MTTQDTAVSAAYMKLHRTKRCFTGSEPRRGRCWWRCSESPLTVFAEAALNWLVLTRKIPLHRIVVYGRSIGSGPAVQLVSERPNSFAGLVLESSLASVVGVKCSLLAKLPCVECMDMFVNHRKIKLVKCASCHGQPATSSSMRC